MREIYSTKGMKGFYAGAIPNMTRCLLKNTYRYPLMVGLPSFYNSHLPQTIRDSKEVLRLLTGCSIAFFESTITCPIERLKVYFMTTSEKFSYAEFFRQNKGRLAQELFRGFTPLFMRQSMAWIMFLQVDLIVKKQIR